MNKILTVILFLPLLMPFKSEAQDTIDLKEGEVYTVGIPNSDRPMHPLTDTSALLDTLQTWSFHLSMGSSVYGGTFGSGSGSLFGIRPTVIYRPNDRLKIKASASVLNSYSLATNGYTIQGRRQRSMAPLRNSGTAAVLEASASYKVSDRLWLAASLSHWGGELAAGALFSPLLYTDSPLSLDATAFTASMRYRIGKESFLDIHMTFIDDRTGSLAPALWYSQYGGFYASPFDSWHSVGNPLFLR